MNNYKRPSQAFKVDLHFEIMEAIKNQYTSIQTKADKKNTKNRSMVPNMEMINAAMKDLGDIQI